MGGAHPDKDINISSGLEYERYVAEILRKHGFITKVTKGSGDHGADIIAQTPKGKLVIQCKYYGTPVGNKAVQEAYSAKDIYDAEQAWVVTNNRFTPAAKFAAQKLGVLLINHEDIPELLGMF